MPIEFLLSSLAATEVVPDPKNGSNTVSPGLVKSLINHSGSGFGKTALWFLFAVSVARLSTFVGYARSRPTHIETFLPKPLPTFELSRLLSVSLRFFSRVFAQSPIGIRTSSWYILNFLFLLNCRSRSQASRKRFGHFPGKQFFLCQINSSVQSQPCFRISIINSITYMCLSLATIFSFMFSTKVPVGFNTRNNSFEIGRNHLTYLSGFIPPYVWFLWSA